MFVPTAVLTKGQAQTANERAAFKRTKPHVGALI